MNAVRQEDPTCRTSPASLRTTNERLRKRLVPQWSQVWLSGRSQPSSDSPGTVRTTTPDSMKSRAATIFHPSLTRTGTSISISWTRCSTPSIRVETTASRTISTRWLMPSR